MKWAKSDGWNVKTSVRGSPILTPLLMANCKWLSQTETPFVTFFNKYCLTSPPLNLSIKIYSLSSSPLSFCFFFVPLQMLKRLFLEQSEDSLCWTQTEHSETWLSKTYILPNSLDFVLWYSVVCVPSVLSQHHLSSLWAYYFFQNLYSVYPWFCLGFAILKPFCINLIGQERFTCCIVTSYTKNSKLFHFIWSFCNAWLNFGH